MVTEPDFAYRINPFSPDSAESKIDKLWKSIAQQLSNGHTLRFCTWSKKLENFVSPKVSLWESKG